MGLHDKEFDGCQAHMCVSVREGDRTFDRFKCAMQRDEAV